MTRTVIDCRQSMLDARWRDARLGIPTASGFRNIVTPLGVPVKGAKRGDYMHELLYERMVRSAFPRHVSAAMEAGTAAEPSARAWYELSKGVEVARPGFVRLDGGTWACGASPDGLVGTEGGIEIKCVMPHNQIAALLSDDPPDDYTAQVQGCMWITGRPWWDLVMYSNTAGIPSRVWRIEASPAYHAALAEILPAFCAALGSAELRLVNLGGGQAAVMAGAAESFEATFGGVRESTR